jgi:hypothetical protein
VGCTAGDSVGVRGRRSPRQEMPNLKDPSLRIST